VEIKKGQLAIEKPEDLSKLNGWQIVSAAMGQDGPDPVIILNIHHVAAEFPVVLTLKPTVTFGRSGNKIGRAHV